MINSLAHQVEADLAGRPALLRDACSRALAYLGLELVAPGLVRVSDWRPPAGSIAGFPDTIWAGAARNP